MWHSPNMLMDYSEICFEGILQVAPLWQFLERFIIFEVPWWPLKMVLDFQTPCSLYRVRQNTTRTRCTVTIQSLIDVQIKLQTRLYFIHYKLIVNIIFKPLKCPKMVFWGGGVGFGKFSYVKVGCEIPHSKGFGTHIILVKRKELSTIVIHISRT